MFVLLKVCLPIYLGPDKMLHLISRIFGLYEMHWTLEFCPQSLHTAICGHIYIILEVIQWISVVILIVDTPGVKHWKELLYLRNKLPSEFTIKCIELGASQNKVT